MRPDLARLTRLLLHRQKNKNKFDDTISLAASEEGAGDGDDITIDHTTSPAICHLNPQTSNTKATRIILTSTIHKVSQKVYLERLHIN